jgi:hypothetical protein
LIPLTKEDEFDLRFKFSYLKDEYIDNFYIVENGNTYVRPSFFSYVIFNHITYFDRDDIKFLVRFRKYFLNDKKEVDNVVITYVRNKFLYQVYCRTRPHSSEGSRLIPMLLKEFGFDNSKEDKSFFLKFMSLFGISPTIIRSNNINSACVTTAIYIYEEKIKNKKLL